MSYEPVPEDAVVIPNRAGGYEPVPYDAVVTPNKQKTAQDYLREDIQAAPWWQRQLIGMGGTMANAVEGVKNLIPGTTADADMEKNAKVAAEEGRIGAFTGELAKYAPALAASGIAVPAAIAGVLGTMYQTGGIPKRIESGLVEGGAALAGGALFKGLSLLGNKIGRMGSQDSARRIATEVVGDVPTATRALDNAGVGVSSEQALAGMNRPSISALSDITKGTSQDSAAHYAQLKAQQEATRMADLQGVTPDLKTVSAIRDTGAKNDYAHSFTVNPQGDSALAKMAGNPYFAKAEAAIKDLAEAKGIDPSSNMTEYLHLVKFGFDKMLKAKGDTAISGAEREVVYQAKKQMLNWLETKNPLYKTARENFAHNSKAVNEAQILDQMQSVLQKPGGGERVSPFLNVLGAGEDALIKKSNLDPRFGDLSTFLRPYQQGTVNRIADKLTVDKQITDQLASRGARQGAMDTITSNTLSAKIPNFISPKVAITNAAIGGTETYLNRATMLKLDSAFRDPKKLSDLLKSAPVEERNSMLRYLSSNMRSGRPAQTSAAMADTVYQ